MELPYFKQFTRATVVQAVQAVHVVSVVSVVSVEKVVLVSAGHLAYERFGARPQLFRQQADRSTIRPLNQLAWVGHAW